ncbi:histidine kinase [Synechococcus sp. 65AY6Li]|uniref:GAF domain-containing sensor histidine kinase n=1 Tax=unclassified Synechococcus TaxID=2626047 RepID=UPI000C1A6841|nr:MULTISPECIES: GAF domain-containing protein [unclassified Synechococcus]PIK92741.1 histidine kinase [Synechococcus sp. 65AY6Li]PIK98683.1 histidine kinase [Synechococcus sp. 63AY4M1]
MVQPPSPYSSSGAGAISPLVALQATLQQMREQSDANALIQLTLEYVKAVFGAPLIWLAFYDYQNHQLLGQGGFSLVEEPTLLRGVHPLQPGEILEQVVIEQRPISVPDLSQEPRMGLWQREARRLGGIQGCFIYPFSAAGRRRCLGILMLGSQMWGVTTREEEKALLGILLGQLAASLQELENAWRQQSEKRLEDSLLRLGTAICQAGSLQERVSLVRQELQTCLGAVHIQVYWHERSRGRFVPHGSASRPSQPPTPAPMSKEAKAGAASPGDGGLSLRELGDMYYTLADGQVVVGGTGTTRSEIPLKLMQQLRAQAALAAPILLEKDLLGFIWVQSDVPRTWQAVERQLVAAAANGLALAAPLENLDRRIRQLADEQEFVQQVGRSLYNPAELPQALQQAVVGLGQRLQASAVAVLTVDPDRPNPRLFSEYRSEGKQALPPQFSSLSEQDWQDLLRSEVVAAENYNQDLRLLSWRQELAPLGVRSLMLTHTGASGTATPEGLILVLHPRPRAWSREERQLLRGTAQQVGLLLRQLRSQQRQERQEHLLSGLIATCLTLQNLATPEALYATIAQQAAQLLQIPLALVVSWQPGESRACLQPPFAAAPEFCPSGPTEINRQDPLLAAALQARGPLPLAQDQIPAASRAWLNSVGLGSWLLVPLGETDPSLPEPLGVLILGAEADRVWEAEEQAAVTLMAQTCGWTLRRLLWVQTLQERQEVLSELNWYKHRRLLDLQNALLDGLRRLGQVPGIRGDEATRWQKVVEIGRELRDLAVFAEPLLQTETWQVQPQLLSVPLATLVRKSLRRVEGLTQKRKLWPRAHGDLSLVVQGDVGRLEMILWEVLLAAALRSPEGGRLDLWSQATEGYAELLVVDQGSFDPHLLTALQWDPQQVIYADPLFQSPLSASPGLELGLCQRLLQRMGGQLSFYSSGDGRSVARLLLPLAGKELRPPAVASGGQGPQQPKQGQQGQRPAI